MRVAVLRLLRSLPAVAVLVATGPALAASQRTFVASNGSEANACSLVAPCRSFTRALTQTSPKGEIVVLDSAGYGPVTSNAVKVDGVFAETDISKSMFDEGISFATFNKGVQKVYGDNSGWPQWSGVAPFPVGTF